MGTPPRHGADTTRPGTRVRRPLVSAALAGIVLLAFATRYKRSVQGGTAERTALIADRLPVDASTIVRIFAKAGPNGWTRLGDYQLPPRLIEP